MKSPFDKLIFLENGKVLNYNLGEIGPISASIYPLHKRKEKGQHVF